VLSDAADVPGSEDGRPVAVSSHVPVVVDTSDAADVPGSEDGRPVAVSSHVPVVVDTSDAADVPGSEDGRPVAVSSHVPVVVDTTDSEDGRSNVVQLPILIDDDDFEPDAPVPKRRRIVRPPHPTTFPSSLPTQFYSPDAVKQALKEINSACIPVLRSSSGKYVRFSCRHASSSFPCPLNVSGSRAGNIINLSPNTYIAGDCNERICSQCKEDLVTTCHVPCPNNHRFCLECFDHIVVSQVRTDKASFITTKCEVLCQYCSPASVFDMQAHIKCVKKETWQHYIDAHTECAVIAEQQRLQSDRQTNDMDPDLAFVPPLISRMCPNCKCVMAEDFDGCLSLKCGRFRGGAGPGCGQEFCGYCSEVFESEIDVHHHLQVCVWNPRPGSVFPSHDYKDIVWQLRRERVWHHVMSKAAHKIPSIWDKIANAYPELALSSEWLAKRAQWLKIAAEFRTSVDEFAALIPKYSRCVAVLQDMGFDLGEESLLRAAIVNMGDPQKAVVTLFAHQSHTK
jgi:hypothetical protein